MHLKFTVSSASFGTKKHVLKFHCSAYFHRIRLRQGRIHWTIRFKVRDWSLDTQRIDPRGAWANSRENNRRGWRWWRWEAILPRIRSCYQPSTGLPDHISYSTLSDFTSFDDVRMQDNRSDVLFRRVRISQLSSCDFFNSPCKFTGTTFLVCLQFPIILNVLSFLLEL